MAKRVLVISVCLMKGLGSENVQTIIFIHCVDQARAVTFFLQNIYKQTKGVKYPLPSHSPCHSVHFKMRQLYCGGLVMQTQNKQTVAQH